MKPLRTLPLSVCLLAGIGVSAILSGCAGGGALAGYSHEELFAEDVQSVAVPIFENRTFYRQTEFKLTEALIKEIEQRTPYKVTDSGSADTILTGTVLSVNQRLLSRDFESGLSQEVQVVVTVGFEWKDLRSGEIRRKRARIRGTGEYIPTRGAGEPFEVARHEAVDDLATRLVSAMRSDW